MNASKLTTNLDCALFENVLGRQLHLHQSQLRLLVAEVSTRHVGLSLMHIIMNTQFCEFLTSLLTLPCCALISLDSIC